MVRHQLRQGCLVCGKVWAVGEYEVRETTWGYVDEMFVLNVRITWELTTKRDDLCTCDEKT